MSKSISFVASRFMDWLAPRACVGCGGESREALCSGCRARVVRAPSRNLDAIPVLARGCFEGPLRDAVHRLKYGSRPDLARPLGALLAPALDAFERGPTFALVPVPLHPARLVERGYNQAALLARALGNRVGARVLPLALARSRPTKAQARLGRTERRQNVNEVFRVRRFHSVAGLRVVLVDDVVTTGATARDCIRALEDGGAEVVGVVSVATANPPMSATELL